MSRAPSAAWNKNIVSHKGSAGVSDASRALSAVDLISLLHGTCAAFSASCGDRDIVEFRSGASERCMVPSDVAAPLVLIVTEAITNAIKYAHPTGVPGRITVTCQQNLEGAIAVHVTDDGIGLPEDFDSASDGNTGLRMMRTSSERIGATLAFKSTSLGLDVRLRMPPAAVTGDEGMVAAARHPKEQAALYQLTDRLFRAGSPQEVFDAALDSIRLALDCSRSSILLFDGEGAMRFVASRGLSEGYRKAVEGHSPWTRDAKDPKPVYISDIETADIDEALKTTLKGEGIGALAFIPLMVKGELIGKFMIYHDVPHEFTSSQVDIAITIARQLGFGVERVRAAQTSRLLASIIETSDDAIVSKDLDGVVTSWNHGAERIFGYSAEEMMGRPIAFLIPRDRPNEEPEILRRVRRGERVRYETVRQRKDGTLIDVSLCVSPIQDGYGSIVGASKIARDVSERKRAEQRQELLMRELHHRTGNIFSVVQSLIVRSFSGKRTVEEAEEAILSRLHSLAQTHVMLIDKEWRGGDIAKIMRAEMSPYGGRVSIEGPTLLLNAQAAQNFALAVHELATNAAKYGALSNGTGYVDISWSVLKPNGLHQFKFCWRERGGPVVTPPKQKGFGTTVLERVMAEYFETPPLIEFARDGVRYEVIGSLEAIIQRG